MFVEQQGRTGRDGVLFFQRGVSAILQGLRRGGAVRGPIPRVGISCVRSAIACGQFDIQALKASRQSSASESKAEEKKITLREFYDSAIVRLWESLLAPATYQSYEGSFRVHVLPELANVAVEDITRDRLKDFIVNARSMPLYRRRQMKSRDFWRKKLLGTLSRLFALRLVKPSRRM